jgi:hypothetical protein
MFAPDPSPVSDQPLIRPGVIRRTWGRWRRLAWWKRGIVHLHLLAFALFLLGCGLVVHGRNVVNRSLAATHATFYRREAGQWRGLTFGPYLSPVVWFEVDTVVVDPLDHRELGRFPVSMASYRPASKTGPVAQTRLVTGPDEMHRIVKEADRAWAELRDRLSSSEYRSRAALGRD